MPGPLWVLIITGLALTVPMPVLIGLVMFLLSGGRKGNMRTEREVAHAGLTIEQARSLYAERLVYDGFVVNSANPMRLEAMKPQVAGGEVYTHADKGLRIAVDFAAEPDGRGSGGGGPSGVRVRVAAWMDDFIVYDTGEGRLIDLTLDRLIGAELDREPPPVVPNRSLMAVSSLVSVLLSVAIIAALSVGLAPANKWTAAAVAGAAFACVISVATAVQGLSGIRRRPAELTGGGIATAAIVLGLVGIIASAAALWLRFGEIISTSLRELPR